MNRKLVWIDPHDPLPPTEQALTPDEGANGLLAAGADLSAARLIEAYSRGVFPWFSRGEPVLWWTPSPRMVLMLNEFKISKSLRKTIRQALEDDALEIQTDHNFPAVMQACAEPRLRQSGTWISSPMIEAYSDLHAMGYAHSVCVMREGRLMGGLYCVSLGRMVFGESMFSRAPDCSKLALAALVAWLRNQGALMIDCQQRTDHLASLGGREIERTEFESMVHKLTGLAALPWSSAPPNKRDLAGI
ncbi:MAG: leucyl/phenylalanyl-tRNA--protein transferase [Burkholderiaceae bacterium]|nr:leucyl/phenylalanyl-tRNA--protein transferase [Burkholderiaceae bacterium]